MPYKHSSAKSADFTLSNILDISSEGFWDWNASTGQVKRSPGWYRMLEYDIDIFKETVFTWEDIIHPDDYRSVMKHFENYITGKSNEYRIQYRCRKSDNSYLWIEDSGKIVERTKSGEVLRMIGAHTNIHNAKIAEERLEEQNRLLAEDNLTLESIIAERTHELDTINKKLLDQIEEVRHSASHDLLTGVFNRKMFEELLTKEMHRAKRYNTPLSIILIDIDDFKHINDEFGHKIGDEVLVDLAVLVEKNLRESDTIARWGGEEFIIILPEMPIHEAAHKAEMLRVLIEEEDFTNNLSITCSFGVTHYLKGDSINSIFIRSDNAMYEAKNNRKNNVKILTSDTKE